MHQNTPFRVKKFISFPEKGILAPSQTLPAVGVLPYPHTLPRPSTKPYVSALASPQNCSQINTLWVNQYSLLSMPN